MLEIRSEGSGTVGVAVCGELDMHDAPRFRMAVTTLLNRGDVTAINIDLADVTVLDATGAGILIVAHRIAINLRVTLRLCAVSAPAAEVLTLCGAADLLPRPDPADPDLPGSGSGGS
jgi:anti-anti-sigma factor